MAFVITLKKCVLPPPLPYSSARAQWLSGPGIKQQGPYFGTEGTMPFSHLLNTVSLAHLWRADRLPAYCSMCHRSFKWSLKFIEGEKKKKKKVTGTRYYTTSWENLWLRRRWPSFGTAKGLLFERANRQLLSCNHWFKLNWHKDIMKTWVKYNKREKKIFFPRYIYPCFKVVCYSHDIIDRWTSHSHIFSLYFLSDQVKA